jgi:glutamate N-acetyltransferase/amino-acid N-acetyltransferase
MPAGDLFFPIMPTINGVKLSAVSAGIKKNNQLDLMLIELPAAASVAGVFTQNAFCAAPVTVCREHITQQPRYLLVNAGNANACTGKEGMAAALDCCSAIASHASVLPQQVLPFSTGVIGELLPAQKIIDAVPKLLSTLDENNWSLAAKSIMTTDTCAKGATRSFEYEGETIVVNGIAKGAGMIKPNMATMLGFVATNASIGQDLLNKLSFNAANQSFNRITIDGDTSTNDSCILIASNHTSVKIEDASGALYSLLERAVIEVHTELAQAIVRDGEGATKFISVKVEEGATANECLQVAYAIAHSPLVKTACFASDPNWGRIVAAIGYAGVDALDVDKIRVYLGDVLIVENGGRAKSYSEEAGQAVMDQAEIVVHVCLGRGSAAETIWTTDLSHQYVTINAEYRT